MRDSLYDAKDCGFFNCDHAGQNLIYPQYLEFELCDMGFSSRARLEQNCACLTSDMVGLGLSFISCWEIDSFAFISEMSAMRVREAAVTSTKLELARCREKGRQETSGYSYRPDNRELG